MGDGGEAPCEMRCPLGPRAERMCCGSNCPSVICSISCSASDSTALSAASRAVEAPVITATCMSAMDASALPGAAPDERLEAWGVECTGLRSPVVTVVC
jgi:hypothetical protein